MANPREPSKNSRRSGSDPNGLGVVLVPGGKEKISKAQRAFKRLVTRIENLRKQIGEKSARLTECLEFYGAEIRPLEVALADERKAIVRLLMPFLKGPSLGRKQGKAMLRKLIRAQLIEITEALGELTDEDLRAAVAAVEGKSLDEIEGEGFEEMMSHLDDILGEMGVEADLSKFSPDMSNAELAAEMAELRARIDARKANAGERKERPKNRRELEREAREQAAEELRKRDVGGLYRQLAKLLHPDLEQDPALRAEKEVAMKELTTAYKNSDLHGMLRLEVAWITREQSDASRLTDQKLAIYNQVLKEQVSELESQLEEVAAHPRYQPLMKFVDPYLEEFNFHGPSEKARLQFLIRSVRGDIQKLRGPNALGALMSMLAGFSAGRADEIPF